ncbi:MAG: DinB family protein [Pirellulaceae bacterium]|nr:DinB family protein [Pirellulaceae bacterium]
MSLVERVHRQLIGTRQQSERLLADFATPEQWVHQVHPGSNHALWFAGHMTNSDNFFLSLVAPERAVPLEGFATRFGMGSQPTSSPADYPSPAEILAAMRERRATLLAVLAGLADEDLARKLPAGTPDFLSDVGSVFELAIWHEGVHSGQLTVARRALGHKPLT